MCLNKLLRLHAVTAELFRWENDIRRRKNYHIIAENLPGHGTTVSDCNSTSYLDWIEFVEKRFAYLSFDVFPI